MSELCRILDIDRAAPRAPLGRVSWARMGWEGWDGAWGMTVKGHSL